MSQQTLERIEDWCVSAAGQDVENYLQALGLKRDGQRFAKLNKLQQWLLGLYNPEDFVPEESTDKYALWVKREGLRRTFIEETSRSEKWTTDAGEEEEHPLLALVADAHVKENLDASRQIVMPPTKPTEPPAGTSSDSTTSKITDDTTIVEPPEPVVTLTTTKGNKFLVPQEFANLIQEIHQLRESVQRTQYPPQLAMQRGPATSTQLHGDETQNRRDQVNFQDTFTCHYNENPSANQTSTPHTSLLDRTRPAFNNYGRAWEGGAPQGNLGGSDGFRTNSGLQQSCHTGSVRDIGLIARRWNVKFSGDKSQSIDVFLTRIEACRGTTNLTEEELFQALPELLTGVAMTWYQNEREKWTSWNDFKAAARRWYGTNRRFQQRLVTEANARTQGKEEPVRDYITCFVAILRRIEPTPTLEWQLDLIHKNLRPEIQRLVRRTDFNSIDTLLELAVEAELTIEAEKSYRPPPPPESSLLPELAYNPKGEKTTRAKISGVTTEEDGDDDNEKEEEEETPIAEIVAAISKLQEEWNKFKSDPPKPPQAKNQYKSHYNGGGKGKRPPGKRRNSRSSESSGGQSKNKPTEEKPAKQQAATPPQRGPWRCYAFREIGYRRDFCSKCQGNEERRD